MKRHMKSIFKRVESGAYIKSDSEQMALEIKDQAVTIHVHEKNLDEYAATVCTMQKRIEELATLGRTLSERNRWQVHDMDMLTTENNRLQKRIEKLEARLRELGARGR